MSRSRGPKGTDGTSRVRTAARLSRPPWLNARTIVGFAMFSLAALAGQNYLAQAETTTSVWAAGHDLGAGHALDPEDVTAVEVRLDPTVRDLYLSSTAAPHGLLLRSIAAGELIPSAAVDLDSGPTSVPGRIMTIPVELEHAVGGDLQPGDRVDVFATFGGRTGRAHTALLVRAVEVIGLVRGDGLVAGEGSLTGLTVAVSPQEAARVAHAVRTADIDIVRVLSSAAAPIPLSITERYFK